MLRRLIASRASAEHTRYCVVGSSWGGMFQCRTGQTRGNGVVGERWLAVGLSLGGVWALLLALLTLKERERSLTLSVENLIFGMDVLRGDISRWLYSGSDLHFYPEINLKPSFTSQDKTSRPGLPSILMYDFFKINKQWTFIDVTWFMCSSAGQW